MAFAVDNDLVKYIPNIFDYGVESFAGELAMAEDDVVRYIKINWYNKSGRDDFDKAKLTETQWNRSTIYLALYAFILPQLSTWRPEGDSFQEQISFYKNRFKEEIESQLAVGVEYDMDGDATVSKDEVFRANRGKLWL